MDKQKAVLREFINDEKGGVAEYGIIIGLTAVIAAGGLIYLAPKIKNAFEEIGSKL